MQVYYNNTPLGLQVNIIILTHLHLSNYFPITGNNASKKVKNTHIQGAASKTPRRQDRLQGIIPL